MKLNAKNFSKTLEVVVTQDDRWLLLEELKAVTDHLYQAQAVPVDKLLIQTVRPLVAAAIWSDMTSAKTDAASWLKAAAVFFTEAPAMELTVATGLKAEAWQRLGAKIREKSGKPYMLNINVNPGVLGGVVVEANGEYRDYSLSGKLTALLTEMFGEGMG